MNKLANLVWCVAMGTALPAWAGPAEEDLLAALRRQYPATRFDRVEATPLPNLYAVAMGENVAYVTPGSLRHMVFGRLVDIDALATRPPAAVDTKTQQARRDVAALPLRDAIKRVQGNGRRTLVVFTDPACGYCRQLERELAQVADVTLYYFMVPFLGAELPAAIWCAPDRERSYRMALAGTPPPGADSTTCAHPLERNARLAAQRGIAATPTLLFADGSFHAGAMSAHAITERVAQADSGRKP